METAAQIAKRIRATLCLVCRYAPHDGRIRREILLGWKTEKFCAHHWVGYGGKIEPGETPAQCARRELFAESGITAHDLEKCAIIDFHNQDESGADVIVEVHVFFVNDWMGEPQEKEGAIITPTWFPVSCLPPKIPIADREWLPRVLRGEFLRGKVWHPHDSLDRFARPPELKEVNSFPQ